MSGAIWYYLEAGNQAGPVDQEAIVALIRSSRIAAGALVWKAGMPGWQPWNTVPELAFLAPPAAQPPAPPSYGQPTYGPPAYGPPAYGQSAYGQPYGQQLVYPKAPLGARFAAHLVDGLIFTLPAVILVFIAIFGAASEIMAAAVICGVLGGVLVIAAIIYALLKDGRANGQSIGKKMMNLMVVHLPTNRPCTMGQSAGRAAIMMALGFIPYVGGLIEPIVVLATQDGRRLGDRAANTQVISVESYRGQVDPDIFS
jgi:uncharacterized RDD family membrane protein YckC